MGYRIQCEGCLGAGKWARYEGEIVQNAYTRGLKHQEDLKNEKEDSALCKHSLLEHGGHKRSFIMKTFGNFSSALQRQVNEAVIITSMRADIIVMNSKN